MINPKLFPTLMIIFSLGAALGYLVNPPVDLRRVLYWLASAVLIAAVTY